MEDYMTIQNKKGMEDDDQNLLKKQFNNKCIDCC